MRCLNCGFKIEGSDIKVCPECNEKIVFYKIPLDGKPEKAPPKKANPEPKPTPKPEKPKMKSKLRHVIETLIIILLILGVVAAILIPGRIKSKITAGKADNIEVTDKPVDEKLIDKSYDKKTADKATDSKSEKFKESDGTDKIEKIKEKINTAKITSILKNVKFMEKEADGIYYCSFPRRGVVLSKDLKDYMKIISPVDIQISKTSAEISFRIKCIKSRKNELDDIILKKHGEDYRKKFWKNKKFKAEAFTTAFNSSYKLPSPELTEQLILMDIDEEADIVIKFSNEVYINQLREMVQKDHLKLVDAKMEASID